MLSYKILFVISLIQFVFNYSSAQPNVKFFRKDYTYLDESKSFYKIHTIHRTWQDAKARCALEGASLFYALDKSEADAVLAFWKKTQPFYWVFIGISDLLVKGVFETLDGIPITDVYSNWGPGEPNDHEGIEDCLIMRNDATLNDDKCHHKYPFICKKSLATLQWNKACDLPRTDYIYNAELGKCYKFHKTPLNWTDAYTVCSEEQSYLTVINSQAEADHLTKIAERELKDKLSEIYGTVFLGLHNRDGEGWKSIKGTTLENTGYTRWGKGQPDGADKDTCGAMSYDGQLDDINCSQKSSFICEHDIGLLSSAYDERITH